MWQIVQCKEIIVRAVDKDVNTQPSEITWNVLGMMNNAWYRVRTETDGSSAIIFKHPVQTGALPGGWMVSSGNEPVPAQAPDYGASHNSPLIREEFTMAEVSK